MTGTEWKIRIEGRLFGQESEKQILQDDGSHGSKRFLSFFERVRIEFP